MTFEPKSGVQQESSNSVFGGPSPFNPQAMAPNGLGAQPFYGAGDPVSPMPYGRQMQMHGAFGSGLGLAGPAQAQYVAPPVVAQPVGFQPDLRRFGAIMGPPVIEPAFVGGPMYGPRPIYGSPYGAPLMDPYGYSPYGAVYPMY